MSTTPTRPTDTVAPSADTVEAWLFASVAKAVRLDVSQLNRDTPFEHYGMDSVAAVDMTRELSKWCGSDFPPTLFYDYPTVALLSSYVATQVHADANRG